DEFKRGGYKRIYVTGGPLDKGVPLAQYKTYAELGAAVVAGPGLDTNTVQAVPAPAVRADRTFTSARALRNFLSKQDTGIHRINVVTVGAHSRRTRLLYEKAFREGWEVGMIAVPDESYDARYWYRSSNGVRNILDETIAYVYARFFFRE